MKKTVGVTTEVRRTHAKRVIVGDDASGQHQQQMSLFKWKVSIFEAGKRGRRGQLEHYVDRIVVNLHPTFANPRRVLSKAPFELVEEGYGSFDMELVLHFKHGVPHHLILHPLRLDKGTYDQFYDIDFSASDFQPLPDHFVRALESSVPVMIHSTTASSTTATTTTTSVNGRESVEPPPNQQQQRKRSRNSLSHPPANTTAATTHTSTALTSSAESTSTSGDILHGYNIDALSTALYSLRGQAIINAVTVVKKHRTKSTYVKEEDHGKEFHFDLYTLNARAVKELAELCGVPPMAS